MTESELSAVIEGIVPIVREHLTKSLGEMAQRVAAAEARLSVLGDLKDRTIVLETKLAAAPAAAQPMEEVIVTGLRDAIASAVGDVSKDVATLRERLGVVEVRAALPGPAGPAGKDGANGRDGRDGHDGIALDDLSATLQDDERTMVVRARVGGQIKDIGTLTFPVEIYRGVWVEGKTYESGDAVTWAGSEWHSNITTTSKPGDGSKDWTLKVKRGRDGRDGKDAPSVPVVRAGA